MFTEGLKKFDKKRNDYDIISLDYCSDTIENEEKEVR